MNDYDSTKLAYIHVPEKSYYHNNVTVSTSIIAYIHVSKQSLEDDAD